MITLCGFGVSNYYNKLKLILLEKEMKILANKPASFTNCIKIKQWKVFRGMKTYKNY